METEEKTSRLFDAREPFAIEILSGGKRRTRCRYPSDQQWIERIRNQKILNFDLGRNKTRQEVTPLTEFDFELYKKLRFEGDEGGADFDEYEASLVIDRLAKATVVDVAMDADARFTISILVFGDVLTRHVLSCPLRKDVVEYSRAAVSVTHSTRKSQTVVSLEPSARLYDKLKLESFGYAPESPVPIVHKDVALVELIRQQDPEA